MDSSRDSKRKKDQDDDDGDKRKERKKSPTRARSRPRSPRDTREKDSRRKRRHSKSRSPEVRAKQEKQDEFPEAKKEMPARRAKENDMLNTRTGGAYIPPARLRMMQAQITDKSSVAYQRLAWEALKKSIHGHINKINVGNIGIIIKELLKENIVRGRGLLCRSIIQAQAASPTFTNVYAALVSAVNSRFPNIGELLLKRLVIQFKRGFKRNDKPTCISSASFIAHLVNQRVAHEILALELLTLLVETPTDDSVEVAIAFLKECGQKLTEVSSKGVNAIFEMLRNILHEGQLDKRVQYMIEVMFQVWKDGFKDHPALIEELELVPEEEQFTHLLMLDDATDPQDILNVFKFDDKYEENEQKYKTLSKEILGSDAESGEEDGSGESGSDEEEEEDDNEAQKPVTIIDNTETNLVALRRTIYLTINSSLDFEECAHKLMKMQLKPGQEVELCHMFLDCCAEQRTYEKFYGLLAQRFCNINRIYIGPFEEIFKDSYSTAHRLDTNRLRNVSKFFAHLLFTDSISWEVMECVKLNEEDTTSSSRIYIKILFQELAEYMGLKKLNDRLQDPTLQGAFAGIFPRDNPKNTRFSINFFTSIGLGGLTDELREHLKQMPKNVPAPLTEINLESGSDSSSSSDSSSPSDSSSTDSSEDEEKNSKKKKKSQSKKKQKKTPKTPEGDPDGEKESANEEKRREGERWGHDGFYDTYGKDAQRNEPRPDRQDRNNFVRPRDRNQNESTKERQDEFYDRRNGNERQNRRDERSQRDRPHDEDNSRNRQNRTGRHDTREEDFRNERDDDRSVVRDKGRRDDNRTSRNENRSYNDRAEIENRGSRNEDRYSGTRERKSTDLNNKRHDNNIGDRNRRTDDRESRIEQNVRREKNFQNERDESGRSKKYDERNRNYKESSRSKHKDDSRDKRDREQNDDEEEKYKRRERDRDDESHRKRDRREERAEDSRRHRYSEEEEKKKSPRCDKEQNKNNSRMQNDLIDSRNNRQKNSDEPRHKKEEGGDEGRHKDKSSKKKNKKEKNRKGTDSEDSSSREKSKKKNKKRKDISGSDESESEKKDRQKKNEEIHCNEWDIASRKGAQEIVRYWDSQR